MDQTRHEVLMKVATKTSNRFAHDIYDKDDIFQEAYLLGMELYDKCDSEIGPAENFISKCVCNHFLNRIQKCKIRTKILETLSLDIGINFDSNTSLQYHLDEYCSLDQLKEIADDLPSSMRKDYLKLLGGVPISNKRKEAIRGEIKEAWKADER